MSWQNKNEGSILSTQKHVFSVLLCCVAVQEKRGHRESRLLENLNKMVEEANEEMLPANFATVNQDVMSNIIKRCKSLIGVDLFPFKLFFNPV